MFYPIVVHICFILILTVGLFITVVVHVLLHCAYNSNTCFII